MILDVFYIDTQKNTQTERASFDSTTTKKKWAYSSQPISTKTKQKNNLTMSTICKNRSLQDI